MVPAATPSSVSSFRSVAKFSIAIEHCGAAGGTPMALAARRVDADGCPATRSSAVARHGEDGA
jgi:hypothetical protein